MEGQPKTRKGTEFVAELPHGGPWKMIAHYDHHGNYGILFISPDSPPHILRDGKLYPADFGATPDDPPL